MKVVGNYHIFLLLTRPIALSTFITRHSSIFLLAIPIVLSAFTHLWNPIGFPGIHIDEGHYMRKAIYVLEGLGLQESPEDVLHNYDSIYTHPYFGQLFLAAIFSIIGYPDSLNLYPGDVRSIEMVWFVPRILMGLLAVVDTFLIYKIAERRYNRNIALIASILFAVMPITWLLRRILLDSILLPFLLSSILFAIYSLKRNSPSSSSQSSLSPLAANYNNNYNNNKNNNDNKKRIILVLLSGIFLGLAIFTKIPAFTMILLVGFLVYTNSNRDLKMLGLWFIPVVLIPLAWPAYAISNGEFDLWLKGILWQTHRVDDDNSLSKSISFFFKIDPVLLIVGIVGLAYSAIKKDFFLFIWVIPFLLFLDHIGYVTYFHLIPLLPAFCIAGARLIGEISNKITNKQIPQVLLPVAIISAIGIFGFITIAMLITINVTPIYFKAAAFLTQHLQQIKDFDNNNNITIIGRPTYLWIPKYIFNYEQHNYYYYLDFENIADKITQGKAKKILFIVDGRFNAELTKQITKEYVKEIQNIYNKSTKIATIGSQDIKNPQYYDPEKYPYSNNLNLAEGKAGRISFRALGYAIIPNSIMLH
jgi:hypothetical protein